MMKKIVSLGIIFILFVATIQVIATGKKDKDNKAALSPIEQCRKAFNKGSYRDAMQLALEARKANPKDPAVAEMYGRIGMAMGTPKSAIAAFNVLCRERGSASDFRLLAMANKMAGRISASNAAIEKAKNAKDIDSEDLYALAWNTDDIRTRVSLLNWMAKEFPATKEAVSPEIAFWSSNISAELKTPGVGKSGVELKMKTLYNLEWLVCKTAEGKDLWLLIDTAARRSVISEETAEHLGIKDTVKAAFPLPGAYEGEDAHSYTLLRDLDFKGFRLENVPVLIVDDGSGLLRYREGRVAPKGIIGMDILGRYNFRFDRKNMKLTLFPHSVTGDALKGESNGDWSESRAFLANNQIVAPSNLGDKQPVLALIDTGCTIVMAADGMLDGSGLKSSSRDRLDLTPTGSFMMPKGSVGTPMTQIGRVRNFILGWLCEAMPLVGKVRTVPHGAVVRFGTEAYNAPYLPLYPKKLGSKDLPVGLVIGRQLTDLYTLAFDFKTGKMYSKKVLFK